MKKFQVPSSKIQVKAENKTSMVLTWILELGTWNSNTQGF